jgi:signal transduction histidine kinase
MAKSVLINNTPHQKSLKGRFIKYFAGTVVGVMVCVIVIVSAVLIDKLEDELKASLSTKAYHVIKGMERRIDFLIENIDNFSNNHFIINSLIHPHGREQYLFKMVDDFSRLESIDSVTVIDYAGNLIHSSLPTPPNYKKLFYLRPTLETGKSVINMSRDLKRIVIMEPIQHYQTPVGAVISEIDLADLVSRIMPQGRTEFYKIYSLSRLLLSDNFKETATYIVVGYNPDEQMPYLNTLQVKIELGTLKSKHLKPVLTIVYELIGIGSIIIFISVLISIKVGNNLARPVLNMVQQTSKAGNSPEQRYSPVGTGDELEILAQALDDREAKLIKFRKNLEEMVDDRTEELTDTQERLRQTIDELKAANEISEKRAAELETFSYSVSHDLKAPLRGMDGYSKLLVEKYADHFDEEGLFFLKMIRQATQKMGQLIEDLLFYARIDKIENNIQEIELVKMFEALFKANRQALEGFVTETNLRVENIITNQEVIEHAFTNLMENAIKFSRNKSKPKIIINSYEKEMEWVIEIKDNGIGFDIKYHDLIFGVFQRLENNEDYPGTGVGLAIVKKMIDRVGGRVWAEAAPSQGASFHVALPIRRIY